MVMTANVLGLTTADLCEAMQTLHASKEKVLVDIGDGLLRLVETIKGDEVNGEQVVILRALL